MKIHHIGYIVKNIEESINHFTKLGYEKENVLYSDNKRKIYIQFMKNDNYRIELISPIEKECEVDSILKKQGESPYHICYEVDNIYEHIEELKNQKYIIIKNPEIAVAMENKLVAFLFKKGVGLIELVES